MQKKMTSSIITKRKRDDLAVEVASITKYSYDYVRRVRIGERHNDEIEAALVELKQKRKLALKEVANELYPPSKNTESTPKTRVNHPVSLPKNL